MNPPVPRPAVWLTRDSYEGATEDFVDVWEALPVRHDDYAGEFVEWLDLAGDLGLHVESITLVEAKLRFRTVPDNDRECVRIG